jgi:hypothetical protein
MVPGTMTDPNTPVAEELLENDCQSDEIDEDPPVDSDELALYKTGQAQALEVIRCQDVELAALRKQACESDRLRGLAEGKLEVRFIFQGIEMSTEPYVAPTNAGKSDVELVLDEGNSYQHVITFTRAELAGTLEALRPLAHGDYCGGGFEASGYTSLPSLIESRMREIRSREKTHPEWVEKAVSSRLQAELADALRERDEAQARIAELKKGG